MMHPHTTCRQVNECVGLGVFATQDIPKGTIMNIESSLDILIEKGLYEKLPSEYRSYVDTYSYVDEGDICRINWDHARYLNHCCFPNTLTTAYGFEIAIENIKKGEQVTCDYRLFNHKIPELSLICNQKNCVKMLKFPGLRQHIDLCDEAIKNALRGFSGVPQPLFDLMDNSIKNALEDFLKNNENYESLGNWVIPK